MALLEELDAQNPQPSVSVESLDTQIAAVSSGPSLSQMMDSPSFWENLDFSAVGDIASPSGDNCPNVQ